MICRYCRRYIDTNSAYCNWCGGKQFTGPGETAIKPPKKVKDGYSGRIMVKGERFTVTAETEDEYYKLVNEYRNGRRKVEDNITLSAAIDLYLQDKSNRLQERSKEQYEYIRDKRFQSLMSMKLCDITDKDIDRAINAELAKPSRKGGTLSPKTVRDAIGLVMSVINRYSSNKVRADLPEKQKSFHDYPTVEEVVKAVIGTDIELPCLLALWLGMSAEEIRGLTKGKSYKNGKLYIVETVVDTKDGPLRKPRAKAKDRMRAYDVPEYIQKLIDQVDDDIIEPRTSHALYMRLQRVLNEKNVKKIRFHDLRHLNTATQTSLNIPSKVIQDRNGWSSDKMIQEVYDYVFPEERRAADKAMDDYYNALVNENCHETATVAKTQLENTNDLAKNEQ